MRHPSLPFASAKAAAGAGAADDEEGTDHVAASTEAASHSPF